MLTLLREEVSRSHDRALGIMDFRYAPIALGDTVTWLTKLQVLARSHGVKKIEGLISVPPYGWLSQYVTSYNYVEAVQNILPAFLCAPMMSSLRVYSSPTNAASAQRILGSLLARAPSWPSLFSHFRRNLDYQSHFKINEFFRRHQWIPKLASPKGFRAETEAFKKTHIGGRTPVVINIRQSALTGTPATLMRDSPADVWHEFLVRAQKLWPSVVFVLVGDFSAWERRIGLLPNVLVPRVFGYGLGHELTLLLDGSPFFGSSSGFAAVATFSDVPYCITRFQYGASGYMKGMGFSHGSDHYPFAAANQWLSWVPETVDLLVDLFARLWNICRPAERWRQ